MQTDNSDFYFTAKKLWNTVVKSNSIDNNVLELRLGLYKRLLNIFQAGNYYYLLFNIYRGEIEYTSQEIEEVLGYAQADLTILDFMNLSSLKICLQTRAGNFKIYCRRKQQQANCTTVIYKSAYH